MLSASCTTLELNNMATTLRSLIPYRENYELISVSEWSYLAGLIDGEGSIYICYDKRNDVYFMEMSVTNTARSLIDWLLGHFGGTERISGKSQDKAHPDQWAWVVRGRKAAPIIAGVKPYLVIKKQQANLAEEFIATYRDISERSFRNAERQRIKAEITNLNSFKGKKR
jgi:hypothetical protein